jgi:hypothetical protein
VLDGAEVIDLLVAASGIEPELSQARRNKGLLYRAIWSFKNIDFV